MLSFFFIEEIKIRKVANTNANIFCWKDFFPSINCFKGKDHLTLASISCQHTLRSAGLLPQLLYTAADGSLWYVATRVIWCALLPGWNFIARAEVKKKKKLGYSIRWERNKNTRDWGCFFNGRYWCFLDAVFVIYRWRNFRNACFICV